MLLVVATLRGDQPEEEGGEDVDLTEPADWVTVGQAGRDPRLHDRDHQLARLGDHRRHPVRRLRLGAGQPDARSGTSSIGVVLSVGSWYAFYVGLGIPLTPGILDGVL